MLGLPHRAVLFAPAEDAFDHLAPRLRHTVTLVPRRAGVDRAVAVVAGFGFGVVLCHMWCRAELAQHGNMVCRVISLVLANRGGLARFFGLLLQQRLGRATFRRTVRLRDHASHGEPVAVFHQRMAHIAQFRLAALRLAVQAAVGVGRAGMRVIFAFLAVNVLAAVAVAGTVLGFEAFVAGQASINVPSTENCAFDNNGSTVGCRSNALMNFSNTSLCCSRSRFFVNVVASHTGASGDRPQNQRNSRL